LNVDGGVDGGKGEREKGHRHTPKINQRENAVARAKLDCDWHGSLKSTLVAAEQRAASYRLGLDITFLPLNSSTSKLYHRANTKETITITWNSPLQGFLFEAIDSQNPFVPRTSQHKPF